jgi:hypothetical protein
MAWRLLQAPFFYFHGQQPAYNYVVSNQKRYGYIAHLANDFVILTWLMQFHASQYIDF